jgi:zinc transport system substrate-binding protein
MKEFVSAALLLGLALGPVVPRTPPGPPKPRIVVSIFPLLEFAGAVAGEDAEVSLLLPPGAGVHTWQPRASDIIRMSEADVFVHVGGGLEPWVGDFLASLSNRRLRVMAVADFLEMEKGDHPGEAADPHVWLDFGIDRKIVGRLAAQLGEIDRARAAGYADRASVYDRKLEDLDRQYAEGLAACANRVLLLAGHEAFGYLARRYGLRQLSLSGLSPDAEPTPKAVISMIETARRQEVGAVFREAGESPRLADLLAEEIPAKVFVLNTGANLSRQDLAAGSTFLDLMRANLVNLKQGLGCE